MVFAKFKPDVSSLNEEQPSFFFNFKEKLKGNSLLWLQPEIPRI